MGGRDSGWEKRNLDKVLDTVTRKTGWPDTMGLRRKPFAGGVNSGVRTNDVVDDDEFDF